MARILVVDDDAFTASLTGAVLEEAGYDVLLSEGAVDALERLAGDPAIRAVVSDLNMPFMNGVELFNEMREAGHVQPFLLLTAEGLDALRLAHPDLDAVVGKDEALQDTLPAVIAVLLQASAAPVQASLPGPGPARLPGLDLEKALAGLNGKWSRLQGLLADFAEEFGQAPAELERLLASGNLKGAAGKLHTLKGIAGMLAAGRLGEATAAVEGEVKAGQVPPPSWPEFTAAFGELLGGIQAQEADHD